MSAVTALADFEYEFVVDGVKVASDREKLGGLFQRDGQRLPALGLEVEFPDGLEPLTDIERPPERLEVQAAFGPAPFGTHQEPGRVLVGIPDDLPGVVL